MNERCTKTLSGRLEYELKLIVLFGMKVMMLILRNHWKGDTEFIISNVQNLREVVYAARTIYKNILRLAVAYPRKVY